MRCMASNGRSQPIFPPSPQRATSLRSIDSSVRLYDDTSKLYLDDPSENWFCFSTLTGHSSTVWSLAWAPNGRYLASASDDYTIRIWKRITEHERECVLVLEDHDRTVDSVTWGIGKPGTTQTGCESLGWISSTGGDGRINVWAFEVSRRYVALCAWRGLDRCDRRNCRVLRLENAHGVSDVN
jgi:WD40 repeat protein